MSGRGSFLYRALLCLLCALCALGAGCAAKQEPAPVAADVEITPVPSAEAHTTKYRDGIYTATAPGYGGDVTVTATIADDVVLELSIEGAEETRGVGTVAMERVRERILAAQFGSYDGVSGATQTSDAIRAAFKTILEKAQY